MAKSQPYLDRLRALGDSNDAVAPQARLNHDFGVAYARWYTGDVQGTLQQIRTMTGMLDAYPPAEALTVGIVDYYLSLGRAADAARFAASLPNPQEKQLAELVLSWSIGDSATLKRLLSRHTAQRPPSILISGPVYVRAGLREQAEEYIGGKTPRYDEGFAAITRGQLRLLDGDLRAAVRDLQRGVELTASFNNPSYWWGCESLADTLWGLDQQAEAITTLEQCSRNEFKTIGLWAPLGIVRMSLDLHLADLYRRTGDDGAARVIEQRLRGQLALADEKFPLLQKLNDRNRVDHKSQ